MKNLYIMRHAKSDWSNTDLDDQNRILNYVGRHEAALVAQEFGKRQISFDVIISSPAVRAMQTAEIIANKCGYNKQIEVEELFYFGGFKDVLTRLKKIDNSCDSVLLLGHNPLWSKMVMDLSVNSARIFLDTACFVSLSCQIDKWSDFEKNCCLFNYLFSPKNI